MQKQSPVETRKIMEAVHTMVLAGVGFIPVPFTSEAERIELLNLSNSNLEKLATMTESEDNQ